MEYNIYVGFVKLDSASHYYNIHCTKRKSCHWSVMMIFGWTIPSRKGRDGWAESCWKDLLIKSSDSFIAVPFQGGCSWTDTVHEKSCLSYSSSALPSQRMSLWNAKSKWSQTWPNPKPNYFVMTLLEYYYLLSRGSVKGGDEHQCWWGSPAFGLP